MFIDPETRGSVDVQDYISRLFPLFRGAQLHSAARNYQRLGDPFDQVVRIMGDGEFIFLF